MILSTTDLEGMKEAARTETQKGTSRDVEGRDRSGLGISIEKADQHKEDAWQYRPQTVEHPHFVGNSVPEKYSQF